MLWDGSILLVGTLKCADQASLDAWENSEVALSLIDEVSKYSTFQRVTGLETWFTLPQTILCIILAIGITSEPFFFLFSQSEQEFLRGVIL